MDNSKISKFRTFYCSPMIWKLFFTFQNTPYRKKSNRRFQIFSNPEETSFSIFFDWTFQLADLRSVGISGAPLNFVDSNSFNRIFTIGPMGKNIFHNFTQNTSSSIFFVFCPLMTLSEPTWMVH